MTLSRTEIIKIIKNEQYPSSIIENTADKIINFSDATKASFEFWYKTGKLDDFQVEGYTLGSLINEEKLLLIGAYLMMDWLIKDPEKAKASLKMGIK